MKAQQASRTSHIHFETLRESNRFLCGYEIHDFKEWFKEIKEFTKKKVVFIFNVLFLVYHCTWPKVNELAIVWLVWDKA